VPDNYGKVKIGVDVIIANSSSYLKGKKSALLANQASVTSGLQPTASALISQGVNLVALFGPQHGYRGYTQANMIEWNGYIHPTLGIPVYSLYGQSRKPKNSILSQIDVLIIDLQDIGARPYTYLWTAMLAMEGCTEAGAEVVVLDRPNPLGGEKVEGPVPKEDFKSFVGLFPLAMRHGLTIGEALRWIDESGSRDCDLKIIPMEGWNRNLYYDQTKLPWIMPSPNMPTLEAAMIYPGTVMLEGTNISEGRGTTRPFEMVGAPWIESEKFAGELSRSGLNGVYFRPIYFRPTWDKYKGEICGGACIHITERESFCPVRCGATIIEIISANYPQYFQWKSPPYEYEYQKLPIDVITGSSTFRTTTDSRKSLTDLFDEWDREACGFKEERQRFLLY
jgi:uncharacterized protein YbbC (DUF1343 family)